LLDPLLVSSVPLNSAAVLPGKGYLASYNESGVNASDRKLIAEAFASSSSTKKQIDYLEKKTSFLIKNKSYTLVGDGKRSVNVVRDVLNLLPLHFISNFILGLPLKTVERPHGSLLDQEVYLKLKEIYNYVFLDVDLSYKVAEKPVINEYCSELHKIVETHIVGVASESIPIIGFVEAAYHWFVEHPKNTHEWLRNLIHGSRKKTRNELANDAVALAVIASVELSQALTHVVDTFLGPPLDGKFADQPVILDTIAALASSGYDLESTNKLKQHITAALRTRPPIPGVYRTATSDISVDKSEPVYPESLSKGDRVYLSFTEAGLDPTIWDTKNKSATPSSYQPLIAGELVKLLGPEWLVDILVPVIRTIFKLKKLQRAPGNSGKLLSFVEKVEGTWVQTYLDYKQQPTPWSADLTITYSE